MTKQLLNISALLAVILAGIISFQSHTASAVSEAFAQGNSNPQNKVRICHATDSHSNPYTNSEVDQDAVDGDLDNDKGQGDHYMEHNGPVWYEGIADHSWGDIIPPIEGVHGGKNWSTEGQAFWNNSCNKPSASPSPSPSPSPSEEPSPSPSVSPSPVIESSPTPTPTPTPTPAAGRQSALGVDVACGYGSDFLAVMDLTDNGNPVQGIEVTFNYNPELKATTNSDGRARVHFPRLSEGSVTAQASGFPSQSAYVDFPDDCPKPVGGVVLGTSTQIAVVDSIPKSEQAGKVLGASTLANTGSADVQIAMLALSVGMATSVLSVRHLVFARHAEKKD